MSAGERKRGAHKTHKPPLSVRDIRFCQKLVTEGLSQYEAYIAAGFPAKATRNATDKAASRLVRNRQIREYIRRLQRHAAACAMASAEEVAAEVRNLATAD